MGSVFIATLFVGLGGGGTVCTEECEAYWVAASAYRGGGSGCLWWGGLCLGPAVSREMAVPYVLASGRCSTWRITLFSKNWCCGENRFDLNTM